MTEPAGFETTDPFTPEARHLTVVSGGLSRPSQSTQLGERLADAVGTTLSQHGITPQVEVIELRDLARDITDAMVAFAVSDPLRAALDAVQHADGVIAVTPTFKASYSGLFKSFWDILDEDTGLRGTPVLLGATGGTSRHSLVVDTAMRPLFSYLRAKVAPGAVFAATDDWGDVAEHADSSRDTPLQARIASTGRDFAEILLRHPAKPRPASANPEDIDLEVTPFDQLLNGE